MAKPDFKFHQSQLGTLLQCPEKFRVEYGKPRDDTHTDSTALGTAVHAGIEYALAEKIATGTSCDVDAASDVALHELDLLKPWTFTKYSEAKVEQLVGQAIDTWYRDIEASIEPLSVEHKFKKRLYSCEDYTITLEGTIDCVQEGIITDWKSGARPYENWERQRWAVQPTAYCFAMDIPLFEYVVLLHDGTSQRMTVWRTQEHFDWLTQQCIALVGLIRADLPAWPKNDAGWHCSETWCKNWLPCKGGAMEPLDWKESHVKRQARV